MMQDFDLETLRDSVAEVLREECSGRAVLGFVDGDSGLAERLWTRAADLGWLACPVGEQDGGLGLGVQGLDLLCRELGRYLAPGPFLPTLTAALWLSRHADEAQRSAYLPAIMAGEMTVAIPAVLAVGTERGRIRLLGAASATLALVPSEALGAPAGGISLIELPPGEFSLQPVELWDCTRPICDLSLEGLEAIATIADANVGLGGSLLASLGVAVASDSLGAARAIAEQTVEYMKTREQFGQPIGAFQALKHRAADLFTTLTIQEHLLAQAVEAVDEGDDGAMWSALAKAAATEAASFVSADCLQLHGGVGFTWEYTVHLFLKRCRLNEVLVAPNTALRDGAARSLHQATGEGRSLTELAL